jgi:hypothetical protein
VKFPGLPLFFWSYEVFKEINNNIIILLDMEMNFLDSGLMSVEKVLVGLDLWEGLARELNLQNNPFTYIKKIYYLGVPFKGVRCYLYGHMCRIVISLFGKWCELKMMVSH